MSYNHYINITDISNGYDYDDDPRADAPLWLQVGRILYLALLAICVAAGLIIFLTCFAQKARAASASWYLYHLVLVSVTDAAVINPLLMVMLSDWCLVVPAAWRILDCVRGGNMVLFNIETLATILRPHDMWKSQQLLRFFLSTILLWVSSCVAVTVMTAVDERGTAVTDCAIDHPVSNILMLVFQNLLPGVLVCGLAFGAMLAYRKHCTSNANGVIGGAEDATRLREWFVCVMVVDGIYIVLKFLMEWGMAFVYAVVGWLSLLRFFESICSVLTPFAMLTLYEVRAAIVGAASRVCPVLA